MSDQDKTYLIGGGAAFLVLVLWVWLIAWPAFRSYSGWWQKTLSLVLSVYVLAAFVGAGGLVGALVLWNYDRIG